MYVLKSAHLAASAQPPEPSVESLFEGRPLVLAPTGRALFWEGDPATDLLQVVHGMVRVQRMLFDGRRAVAGFLGPGDVLGLCFSDTYLFTVEAVTETAVRRAPRAALQGLVQRLPELRPAFVARMRDEICAAQEQLLILLHQCADERLARFLVAMARRLAGEPRVGLALTLPMPRADIADHLGLTVETVCRSMTKLRAQKVISLLGPTHVVVENPGRLLALAGEPHGL